MGGLFQVFLGRGRNFQDLGHCPLLGLLTVPWNCHGTPGCVISLADWRARSSLVFLVPFDSNWLMLCPWAMSFFQKLCPAPFPPVTKPQQNKNHPNSYWYHGKIFIGAKFPPDKQGHSLTNHMTTIKIRNLTEIDHIQRKIFFYYFIFEWWWEGGLWMNSQ